MEELARRTRNRERMQELHPHFRLQIGTLIAALEALGYRPRIQDAWRSPEKQLAAYRTGRSKLRYSFHNVTNWEGKPEALAVDLLEDDYPLNPRKEYLLHLAAEAKARGLTTGIRWGLPHERKLAVDQAIARGKWQAVVKVGWDPCHVETTSITVGDAWRGKRPA
jgi:hypothetical protein